MSLLMSFTLLTLHLGYMEARNNGQNLKIRTFLQYINVFLFHNNIPTRHCLLFSLDINYLLLCFFCTTGHGKPLVCHFLASEASACNRKLRLPHRQISCFVSTFRIHGEIILLKNANYS